MLTLVPNLAQMCGFNSIEHPILTIIFEKQEDGTVMGGIIPRSLIPSEMLVGWLRPSDCDKLPIGVKYSFSVAKNMPVYIRIGSEEYFGDPCRINQLASSMYRTILDRFSLLYSALLDLLSKITPAEKFRDILTDASKKHLQSLLEHGVDGALEVGARKVKALSANPHEIRITLIQKQMSDGTIFTIPVPDIEFRDLLLVLPVTMENPFFPTALFLYETVATALLPEIEKVQIAELKQEVQRLFIESIVKMNPQSFSDESLN
ncbi:MAG: hypothetical protein UU08_C0008G0010 [Candidatus Uhrbacteria bacterium GW2011_GWE2_40_58]|nr:MAG: hypothetical protein UT94_C0008G0010 [Candidatus Uhrbacteria bacterium GW2011_GWF2_40_263]KKR67804.1 MAG: hypothetical protein UU08_C0008G0010 [Candidatus Uhrbacteria bacterium GW2011_GWE2_40_58]OGL94512.1 MAG: hypothetical protein A2239_00490 [Candidatus Uhrbacteria bacterium RIFOXYA2_FULL_40_9]OGL96762.1 MAG: hypothetical protein A2332_04465 [Candidatus Uhrbacteria bacterium RIFOXYB2_FULL_41_18]HBK34478.1 hypothetical protein [Candidatus Uhrbacteria bacterium]